MKTHPHLRRVGLFAAFSLLLSPFSQLARSASSSTPSPSAVSSLTVSGTNTFLSGSTVGFAAGSTVSVSGIFGGTPSGGTLNLSHLTLTLGTPFATDYLLGASGPSVSSSLASRGPAQGISLKGTHGALLGNVAAFGLNPWTIAMTVTPKSWANTPALVNASGTLQVRINPTGVPYVYAGSSATVGPALTLGKASNIAITCDAAGQVIFYVDHVAGTPGVRNSSITDAPVNIGGLTTTSFDGTISNIVIENRALSASEVVALYQTGGPSAADMPTVPAGTALNTTAFIGAWRGDGSSRPLSTFSGASTTGFVAAQYAATDSIASSTGFASEVGKSYRIHVNASAMSGIVPTVVLLSNTAGLVLRSNQETLLTGENDYVLTASASDSSVSVAFMTGGVTGYTTADITLVPLGCLACYSDRGPGIGYQLHDVSGHLSDVTLPVSGVGFVQRSAFGPQQVRATLTWAGSHEAKSLLGQVALPANAVVTSIITTASAASAGAGMTVGSVTTPALFVAAGGYTTAKKVQTLAAQLPAGTATNDLNLVVDPDDQNYTGTIQIAVNYTLAQ